MKLKLPHRDYELDMEAPLDERKKHTDKILGDKIEFHSVTMTVEEYFRHTWNKQNTKIALDILGYYLTKEDKNLEILSNTKQKEMIKGSKRHTTFSGMGYDNQVKVGLVDIEE